MHPLTVALGESGITQEQLSKMVAALRLRRKNGRPLRLAQNTVSQICNFERGTSIETAEAIALALKGLVTITAVDIVFAQKPRKASRGRERTRAA